MSNRDVMLTTVDNPYDPFDDFDHWLTYDIEKGYNTCGLVAAITRTSAELPENFQVNDIEQAIDSFIAVDPLQLFKKVVKES